MSRSLSPVDLQRHAFVRGALAPSLVVLLLIAGLPSLYLIVTSLTPYSMVNPGSGSNFSSPLRNYEFLADDSRFINSLWVQARLSLWGVLAQVLLGTLLALLLFTRSTFIEVTRTFFLIPMVLPPIVVAVIWKLLYTPDISPLYHVAKALDVAMPAMTSSVDYALLAIIIADTWEWFPFTFLMVLATLQTIPDEYSEAATMDGAGKLQIFFHITLPFITPILIVSALFRLIDSIKAFPLIFLLTQGGPGTVTEVTNFYAYILAFNNGEIGYSSAITVILLLIVVLISWAATRAGRNNELMT